ncbi:MAG: hypothetical protein JXR14_01715 [Paracoccaceae bacterium]
MADINKERFDERVKTISNKTQPGKRIERRVNEDGLVVDVVKTDRRGLIPYKSIILLVILAILTKGVLFARLGEAEYLNRIEALKQGEALEVSAAFLLDADPATRGVAWLVSLVLPQTS